MEFKADGTFKRFGIGPTDISRVTEGTWRLESGDTGRVLIEIAGEQELLTVVSLDRDRLAITKA
jgi:hypothetical protein